MARKKSEDAQRYTGRELRWLADAYEQAQRIRIETGERIRAVLQGRDETWGVSIPEGEEDPKEAKARVDAVLESIRDEQGLGPVPILGRTYQRHYQEERELFGEMRRSLRAHPAWPWLSRVKGIGPTLACKLLARLDVAKASTPSSFWAYCGLATVPGTEYRCEVCGLRRTWPEHYEVKGPHQSMGEGKPCKGLLVKYGEARCAQPKASRGEKATYDRYAKKIMFLVGTSFIKAGSGPYEALYREARSKLDRERPGWADGRKHFTALRKAEKIFLSHLWVVWREAEGLPSVGPYVEAHMGHESMLDPWEMVEGARAEPILAEPAP